MIILYWFLVQRRIGGLEMNIMIQFMQSGVQRRIGGLENRSRQRAIRKAVQRRIGGLESIQCIYQRTR